MTMKRYLMAVLVTILTIACNYLVFQVIKTDITEKQINLTLEVQPEKSAEVQIFYLTDNQDLEDGFFSEQCITKTVRGGEKAKLTFDIPVNTVWLRLDPVASKQEVVLGNIKLLYEEDTLVEGGLHLDETYSYQMIADMVKMKQDVKVIAEDVDPYFIWEIDKDEIEQKIINREEQKKNILRIIFCVALDLLVLWMFLQWDQMSIIPKEILTNKRLILGLSKNDFKTKFAGSYLGIIWAFVQPVVTVLVYWFVFEKALNVGTQSTKAGINVPYVLWLIAGLVPWFFFSEVLGAGTGALVEYSYLVKKVVFKISTLPVVKAISSVFVHVFFIIFTLVLYACYGYFPTLYTLQIIYYSFAMMIMVLGLIYTTSAIVCFFRDLSQLIGIVLQVGMWVTPIMWNIDAMNSWPEWVSVVLKLNPMYYIVAGYRDSLINQVWFFEKPELTIYFWLFTIVVFGIGTTIFRKLQVHFADVL